VGHEELGVRRADDQHAHVRIGRDLAAQPVELEHQRNIEQVDRWVVDRDLAHPATDLYPQQREVLVRHAGDARPGLSR
jgi:hypothetical protein